MTHAELLRKHATDATNEGGMWFSGEYLSRIAETAESLEDENAKLRELCAGLWNVMWACAEQRCPHRHEDCFVVNGNGDGPKGHGECWYKLRMRELEAEVNE